MLLHPQKVIDKEFYNLARKKGLHAHNKVTSS